MVKMKLPSYCAELLTGRKYKGRTLLRNSKDDFVPYFHKMSLFIYLLQRCTVGQKPGYQTFSFFWKVSQIFGNFNCVGVILWPSSSGRVSNFGLLIVRVSNFDLFQKGGSQILGLFKREGIKCWPFSSGRLLNFKLF